MKRIAERQQTVTGGFTRTELLVLVGVGALLSSVLAADLGQSRSQLLRDACAANMKHWGLAFRMYADDYNGTFYYQSPSGVNWDDSGTPLRSYLGIYESLAALRSLRTCPSRIGQVNENGNVGVHSYAMPIGLFRHGLGYEEANIPGSPFYYGTPSPSYWPNLKSAPQPAQYLMLIESNGHTLICGGLLQAVSTVTQTDPDQLPAIDRHGGSVNCLFGDFHVEFVSAQTLTNQDSICYETSGNSWFHLN